MLGVNEPTYQGERTNISNTGVQGNAVASAVGAPQHGMASTTANGHPHQAGAASAGAILTGSNMPMMPMMYMDQHSDSSTRTSHHLSMRSYSAIQEGVPVNSEPEAMTRDGRMDGLVRVAEMGGMAGVGGVVTSSNLHGVNVQDNSGMAMNHVEQARIQSVLAELDVTRARKALTKV